MKDIKYYYNIEQGTEEWLRARLGIVTASMLNTLVTPTGKISKSASVKAYAYELAAQRITGFIEESFQSYDMMRGHIQEEIARDIYSENIEKVTECGFITRTFENFIIGASPDGLINTKGGEETKSRVSKFQVQTIVENEIPKDYLNQVQASLFVSGREWWDFIQYSNGMPMYIQRIHPDLERFELFKEACESIEEMIVDIITKYNKNSKDLIKTEWVDLNISDDIIMGAE
jgi:predicted phage-related endonuclease